MSHLEPELGRDTLETTASLLREHPARITGTEGCLAAGEAVRKHLVPHCHATAAEPFTVHPGQLWNVGRVLAVAYVLSAALLYAGEIGSYAAELTCAMGLTFAVVQFILFGTAFDRLFPGAQARNIVGTIEPKEAAVQQVLVVGHHDSPYVNRFLLRFQKLFGLRFTLGMLMYLVEFALTTYWSAHALLRGTPPPEAVLIRFLLCAGVLLVGPHFFFFKRIPSPGAGDNLLASALAIDVARLFGADPASRRFGLERTRLILLSTDAEEAGQRGAKAFVARHGEQLRSLPTFVLNVDSVYRLADLAVLVRDRNGTLRLSRSLAERCAEIARELGYDLRIASIPLGGGGTDAAWFSAAGIEATSIIGMSTSFIRDGLVYHTPWDTVDALDPRAVHAVLEILCAFIRHLDAVPDRGTDLD